MTKLTLQIRGGKRDFSNSDAVTTDQLSKKKEKLDLYLSLYTNIKSRSTID